MGPMSFVNVTTNWAVGTTLSLSQPSSVVVGDVLISVVTATGGSTITPPTGWTSIGSQSDIHRTSYHVVTESDAGPYVWTSPDSGEAFVGGISAYHGGRRAGTVFTAGTKAAGFSQVPSGATITAVTNNAMLIFTGIVQTGTAHTWSPPSGMNERFELSHFFTTIYESVYLADQVVNIGATGQRDAALTADESWGASINEFRSLSATAVVPTMSVAT